MLVPLILLLTLAACRTTNRSEGSVDHEKFARVYARLVKISADTQASSRSTPEQVLEDEGMTREEFRKIVADFNRDPQRWGSLIEEVQKIIEAETAAPPSSASSPVDSAAAPGVRQSSR